MQPMFQNIIITGASSGLGEALAKKYAMAGVHLGLIGRDQQRLADICRYCQQQGATLDVISIDVRERDRLLQWIQDFDSTHPVDLVIANAGIMHTVGKSGPLESREMIDEIFAVNVTGAIDTVNPLLLKMARRGHGSVAIISSLSAYRGLPKFPAYAASKAAVKSYYEAIRGIYAQQGVYISVVCPSYINTRMTEKLRIEKMMLMDVESAAIRIQNGVNKHRPLITFPWYHSIGLQLLRFLPESIADRILMLVFRV